MAIDLLVPLRVSDGAGNFPIGEWVASSTIHGGLRGDHARNTAVPLIRGRVTGTSEVRLLSNRTVFQANF